MDIKNRITGEVYFVTDTVKAEIVNRAEDYRYSSAID